MYPNRIGVRLAQDRMSQGRITVGLDHQKSHQGNHRIGANGQALAIANIIQELSAFERIWSWKVPA